MLFGTDTDGKTSHKECVFEDIYDMYTCIT